MEKKEGARCRVALNACLDTVAAAKKAVIESDKGASELARKPLAVIADRAAKTKARIAFEGPEEMAVVALEKDALAPFSGGLFGRVKFAEATKALEDRDAWAMDVARLGREKTEADLKAVRADLKAAAANAKARRWIRKSICLTLGSGVAAWGLAKDKPWVAGAGLTAGVVGAILF